MSSQAEAVNVLASSVLGDEFVVDSPPGAGNAQAPETTFVAVEPASALDTRTRRSAAYLATRYGLSMLLSIGNMFVLTWWIGPHAYGIFITAVSLTTFLSSISRFGVDTYLVRCDTVPGRREYNIAFTLVMLISALLVMAGFASIPLLQGWYSQKEFTLPYLSLLMSIPVIGLGGIPMARLERALNFRAVAAIELGGQGMSLAVALLLASLGAGMWAPVAGFIAWQIVAFGAASKCASVWPAFQFDRSVARKMLGFGFGFSASLRTWQLRTLVNPLLVGRFGGPEFVAYVAFAIRIAEGLGFVRNAAGRLAIAALAKSQHDRKRFCGSLEDALRWQVIALGPLLCAFALAGPWIVPRFMGQRWMAGVTVYPMLATAVLINSVFNLQASALFVIGRQWTVMRAYTSHVVLLGLATLVLLPRMGIVGYGIAELIACAGYMFLHIDLKRSAPISYRRVIPWLAIFLVFLIPATPRLRMAQAAMLLGVAAIVALKKRGGLDHSQLVMHIEQIVPRRVSKQVEHLLRFVLKFRNRGLGYASAVTHYRLNSTRYHIEVLRRKSGAACDSGWHSEVSTCPCPVVDAAVESGKKSFHFDKATIPVIVASVPDELKRETIARADDILEHRFTFRGQQVVFSGEIDWDSRHAGNLSWNWDLNRHAFFLTLGTAFYYSSHHKYIQKVADLWDDWIVRNPPLTANWATPFEVAARLQNWIWSYFFLLHSGEIHAERLERFSSAMGGHAEYLHAHLEYHWPNNHLLLEAKALYEFALLFPEYLSASEVAEDARRICEQEIRSQVLPDGVHAELCSMYHRIVAGELLELSCLLRAQGRSLPVDLEQKSRSMSKFSRALKRRDGSVPLLGDSALTDTYIRFETSFPMNTDLIYWLGKQPLASEPSVDRGYRNEPQVEVFPDGGYALLSAGEPPSEVHATFDFGAFSECASPNHGHCDALSFELYGHGRPLIVDPGVFFPWPNGDGCTQHFRTTAAHNTVQIDDGEQSELSPLCDVGRRAKVRALRESATAEAVAFKAECVPSWSVDRSVGHRREIRLVRDHMLLVHDEVFGSGSHKVEWSFQFAPELHVTTEARGTAVGCLDSKELIRIVPRANQLPSLCLFRGDKNPVRGWVSRNSAQAVPATLARYTLRTELPFEIEFSLLLN